MGKDGSREESACPQAAAAAHRAAVMQVKSRWSSKRPSNVRLATEGSVERR